METWQMETKQILILEDDEANAQLVKFYLEEDGYAVKIANDIKSFWEFIEDKIPDLISLDVLLPDGDGLKVFEELRQNDRTKMVPVIFVSVREGDKEKGIRMGASGFIGKPFSGNELKNAVSKALKNKN